MTSCHRTLLTSLLCRWRRLAQMQQTGCRKKSMRMMQWTISLMFCLTTNGTVIVIDRNSGASCLRVLWHSQLNCSLCCVISAAGVLNYLLLLMFCRAKCLQHKSQLLDICMFATCGTTFSQDHSGTTWTYQRLLPMSHGSVSAVRLCFPMSPIVRRIQCSISCTTWVQMWHLIFTMIHTCHVITSRPNHNR